MSFWSTFYKQSLGSPWVVQPEVDGVRVPEKIESPFIFWVPKSIEGTPLQEMMSRMVKAIGKDSQDVHFEFNDSLVDTSLLGSNVQGVLVFFGGPHLGSFKNQDSFQVMETFSLNEIQSDPQKKKQTWGHLQKFVGLQ